MEDNAKIVALDKYKALVAGYAGFPLGAQLILDQKINTSRYWIEETLKTNDEAYLLYCEKGEFAKEGIFDCTEIIAKLDKKIILNSTEFLAIRQLCQAIKNTDKYYKENKVKAPRLSEYFSALTPQPEIIKEIDRVFLPSGEIDENCSTVLRRIAKEQSETKARITTTAGKFFKENNAKLQETLLVERNGRSCVLLKAGYRNQEGLIHGESASGLAIYFEPPSLINLNNRLANLQNEWEREIYNILSRLGGMIAKVSPILLADQETYTILAAYSAKAEFMLKHKAINSEISEEYGLEISEGRHPEIAQEAVVANSYVLSADKRILLISGPNTGGKTVSLKLIGLIVLATYCGLPITCDYAKMAIFDQVFLDIGDQQSISASLSTFSSHLNNLKAILEKTTPESLVIIDELGTGTDPDEGAALAVAVLDFLLRKGSLAVLTTHYNQLKQYAYQRDDIQIAAMGFDLAGNRPTYRLIENSSGSSYGLAIAEQYGIDQTVVEAARKYQEANSKESDKLIEELNNRIFELNEKTKKIEKIEEETVEIKHRLEEQLTNIEELKEQEKEKIEEEAKEYLDSIKEKAEKLIAEYKSTQIQPQAIKLKRELEKLEKEPTGEKIKVDLKVGDWAQVKSSGQSGEIIELNKKQIILLVNGLKIKTDLSKVEPAKKKAPVAGFVAKEVSKKSQVSTSIDLLGCRVEEALAELSLYLDGCLLQNLATVTIIHGFGTGALKKAIWEYLKKQKYIAGYRLGDYNEGGGGVTIVEFKGKE